MCEVAGSSGPNAQRRPASSSSSRTRTGFVGFTGLDLAVGKCPVVTTRTMNVQNLGITLDRLPHDHANGRLDRGSFSHRSRHPACKRRIFRGASGVTRELGEIGSPPAPDLVRRLVDDSGDVLIIMDSSPRPKDSEDAGCNWGIAISHARSIW